MTKIACFCQTKAVPEGGWTGNNFHGRAAVQLLRDFVRIKNAAAGKGMKATAVFLKDYFAKIRDSVIEKVSRRAGIKAEGEEVNLDVGQMHALWQQAITEAFQGKDNELVFEMEPKIRGVMESAYTATSVLLSDDEPKENSQAVLRRAQDLCRKVTGLNDTLKKKMGAEIAEAIDQGKTIYETIQQLKDSWPQIAENRIPTIARTEMGRAADGGVKQCLKESETVTHVSVVGCQAIEPNIPTYKGIPTCNIQNVPVTDVDELEFHINHTGAIVPSAFRDDDGHAEHLPVTSGGSPENEGVDDIVPEAEPEKEGASPAAPPPAGSPTDDTVVVLEADEQPVGEVIPPRPTGPPETSEEREEEQDLFDHPAAKPHDPTAPPLVQTPTDDTVTVVEADEQPPGEPILKPEEPDNPYAPLPELVGEHTLRQSDARALDDGRSAIAQVHSFPANFTTPRIKEGGGMYVACFDDSSNTIELNGADGFSVCHEMGHAIDHSLGGNRKGAWFSTSDPGQALMKVINKTPTVRDIFDNPKKARWRYLIDRRELFARAYSQWIAQKSGDKKIMEGLESSLKLRTQRGWQWPLDEFKPISDAFDDLFKTKGFV